MGRTTGSAGRAGKALRASRGPRAAAGLAIEAVTRPSGRARTDAVSSGEANLPDFFARVRSYLLTSAKRRGKTKPLSAS